MRSSRRRARKTPAPNRDEPKWLTLAKQRFKQGQAATKNQLDREIEDLAFYAGEQWPAEIKRSREGKAAGNGLPATPARPTIVINKTREPIRQILNQERQSEMGIELTPSDDFGDLEAIADEQEITLREDLIRRIQRESHAIDAYTWAFARALQAGRGFFGIMTRYLPGKSWDQEVFVQRFYNQACVTLDPAHEQPDGSDAEWGFVGTFITWDQYKHKYPKTQDNKRNRLFDISDDDFLGYGEDYPDWFETKGDTRSCRIVDYYFTELTNRELVELIDGSAWWRDELTPEQVPLIADSRNVVEKSIKWKQLDGINSFALEETDWAGHYIPIVKVLGEELQPYDQERRSEGMVRPARDSNMGFNMMVSKWIEMIGLAPVPPLELDPESIAGFEAWYKVHNTRTLPYLPIRTRDDQGNEFRPLQRTPADVPISAVAGSIQVFDEAIKATTGVPASGLGQVDPALKSSKAIRDILSQAYQGTSHYQINLSRSLTYAGIVINDLLFPIYGRPGRIVRIINGEGAPEHVMLHQPYTMVKGKPTAVMVTHDDGSDTKVPASPDSPNLPPDAKHFTLTDNGRFNVTVKITKNFDTLRQEEMSELAGLISNEPQLMAWFGDLLFKNQDGPGHKELAERAKLMLDPKIQASIAAREKGQAPLPPEVQQQMALAHQTITAAQQEIQKLEQEKQAKIVESESKERIAHAQIQADADKAALDREAKITVAELTAKVDRMQLFLDERARIGSQQHEVGVNAADAAHAQQLQADAHQQAQEQAVTQAALQPAQTDTGTEAPA